jgi:hypothetical protein
MESGVLEGGGTESSRQLRLRLAACCGGPPPPPLAAAADDFTSPMIPALERKCSISLWENDPCEVAEPSSERMELTEVTESTDISLPQDSRTFASSLL